MSVSIIEPTIEVHNDKVLAIANKGYPYHNLADHRRYEELVYSIYQQEINGGSWGGRFDKIKLLQGVRERGRDCILFSDGQTSGLIQCKHSVNESERISRPECVREILKFILYSITDKSLLPDPNNFTYFFSVSYGLTEPALLLLSNFQNEIKQETNIQEWTHDIIAANVSLSELDYNSIGTKIQTILESIKVETIQSQDLDLLLSKQTNQNIVPLFFEVKAVNIDPEVLRLIVKEELQKTNEYSDSSNISIAELLKNIRHASTYLENYDIQLEGLADSHIQRPQVNEIFNWIISPLRSGQNKEDDDLPIALLSGNAGVGKTVIMTELLRKLEKKGIPALGLKADRIYAKSVSELGEKLDLGDHILKVIRTLRRVRDKIVILVDQIDALSASVSINTEYLNTFNSLIHKLIEIEGVRVIVSCRIYDLNYDRELKFYKNQKIFSVGLLEKDQVLNVLSRLKINSGLAQPSLIELLRTVHHLGVFCRVYHQNISLNELRTLNDLYNCLWREKILLSPQPSNVRTEKCRELLFDIAESMSNTQMTLVRSTQFHEGFAYEMEYLKSNNILVESGNELQFFHQTLFDYVFAKKFVESNKTVRQYLIENHQALHIRSSFRMIINFLRDRDSKKYISACNEILFGGIGISKILMYPKFRVHIKLLIVSSIAYQQEITDEERVIGAKLLLQSNFSKPFLDSIDSRPWVQFCVDKGYLNTLLHGHTKIKLNLFFWRHSREETKEKENDINSCYRFLIRRINKEPDIVVRFLTDTKSFDQKGRLVVRVLYFLEKWDELSCTLFDTFKDDAFHDSHSLYSILEKATSFDLNWVIEHYSVVMSKKIDEYTDPLKKPDFSYEDKRVFKVLFQSDAEIAFQFTLDVITALSLKTKSDYGDEIIWRDYTFHMFDYEDSRNSSDTYGILHLLIDEIQQLAIKQSPAFKNFVANSINSDSETTLMLLMYGIWAAPEFYTSEFLKLTIALNGKSFFSSEAKLQHLWRRLLKKVFASLNGLEQNSIIQLILDLRFVRELRVFSDGKRKFHYLNQHGQTKLHYLQAIPQASIDSNFNVKRLYQELQRKFPQSTDYRRPRMGGGIVGPPLEQVAYEKMDLIAWENSFKKYDSNYRGDSWSLKGSMLEHGRAFEAEVLKKPHYFVPLIEKIIEDNLVDKSYAIHGMQGLKSARYNSTEFGRLFKKLIRSKHDGTNSIYIIWLTDLLIDTKTIDGEIIQYLCDKATDDPDPEKDRDSNDALTNGINTVRGAAASRLPQLINNISYKDLIFSTANKVTEDKTTGVRVALMPRLAMLMNLDENETLKVFLNATKILVPEVYKQTPWSASYLAQKHFEEMRDYFENATNVDDMHAGIATILGVAWFNNKKGSHKLLRSLLKKSTSAKGSMIDLALHFISDHKKSRKAKYLYRKFLSETDHNIVNEYSTSFLQLDEEKFSLYLPLLKSYSKSRAASKSPSYFFDYLLKCAKLYPKECLLLISNFERYEKPNITEGGHYDDEPIKVLVGSYNSLRNSNQLNKALIEKSMKLFDKMLLDERFRKTAEQILIDVEA